MRFRKYFKRKIIRLRRIKNILKVIIIYRIKGYPYYIAKKWGRKVHKDLIKDNEITKKTKRWAHRRGFLSYSISKYNLNEMNYKNYFSDFEYTMLEPINNAYEKWLYDRLTPNFVLKKFNQYFPQLYCNIIKRDGEQIYIPLNKNIYINDIKSILSFIRTKKNVLLIPSENKYSIESYNIRYIQGNFIVNNMIVSENQVINILRNLKRYYIIREKIDTCKIVKEMFYNNEMEFVFICSNDEMGNSRILCSYARSEVPYDCGLNVKKRSRYITKQIIINNDTGDFDGIFANCAISGRIPYWKQMIEISKKMSEEISEIEYMSFVFKISEYGPKVINYHHMPTMPYNINPESEINLYLREKATKKRERLLAQKKDYLRNFKRRIIRFLKKHCFRSGFREYMVATWLNTVKDDLIHTKDTTLRQKIWAWRRGFPSYRINQYNLTEKNYREILSDYNYAWLNRINNVYQKWINDKTTLRYILDDVKEYMAEYYFFISKKNGKLFIKKLQDCPKKISKADESAILNLLQEKRKLVMKPNAGTHGDGFYKLEYRDDNFFYVNEKKSSDVEIKFLIGSQKSSYVITEYIEMHDELKKIYPGSVNTIRIMVLNRTCFDPKIVQTYMRIGSSKTGVTDNIAYGGLAAYVNKDNGFYDRAALLKDHRYIRMDNHPDTGTFLEGFLPNWDIVKEGVLKISKMMPQLEYLGFDIAITEEGFKIVEINIHQDIHKAHEFSSEINDFFNDKIMHKKNSYNL